MIYLAVGRGPSPRSVSECKIRHKKRVHEETLCTPNTIPNSSNSIPNSFVID